MFSFVWRTVLPVGLACLVFMLARGLALAATPSLDEFNLPENFLQLITDRAVIDSYQQKQHAVEPSTAVVPANPAVTRIREGRFVRVVRPGLAPEAVAYRAALPRQFLPLRGYRAPILDLASTRPPAVLATNAPTDAQRRAADCVTRRLARDGQLSTLTQVLQILGPAPFVTNGPAALEALMDVGLPVDLLASFEFGGTAGGTNRSLAVVREIARKLSEGSTVESLKDFLNTATYRFAPANDRFRVATENGQHELGMVRMQAGGGYRGGLVPGDTLDVMRQMVGALGEVQFMVSVPQTVAAPFEAMIRRSWRLKHIEQLTLIVEPLPVAAWAQDNGKAGLLVDGPAGKTELATLTPRYACIEEGQSVFESGESFLMDGLRAAGHAVVHSSLLFQGGNVLPVREPKSGRRLLLIGEGELLRNLSLGLTRAQVLEAFRVEFGVDRCVVLPGVSYHLDFDLCVRERGDELIVFVNDTMGAARVMLGLGVGALEKHGALDTNGAAAARADLAAGREADFLRRMTNALRGVRQGRGDFPASFSKFFAVDVSDSAAGNLQSFLLALDLLESSLGDDFAGMDPARAGYLRALRRMEVARGRQTEELNELGWTVVAVPSMGELYRGINYLNGIHHRDGYIMPVFGGFYAPLDQAAVESFRKALGTDFKITHIQSAECQRNYGGVHCVAAAYPRL